MFKRMKRLLRLRNKSGFTLVEVIVACALLGILIVGVMGFATPVLSSVRTKEQNARAVLLSEAICTYIANTIQYSYFVQTFDCAAAGDTAGSAPKVASLTYSGEYSDYDGNGLARLKSRYNDLGSEYYEIRCIGVRWMKVPGESGKKLILTNERVDPATLALVEGDTEPVFNAVFYDGLYPVINFENYTNDHSITDGHGNQLDFNLDDPKMAGGLRITTDIYLSPDCYSKTEKTRTDAMKTFSGVTYADFPMIRSSIMNAENLNKIQPTISANTDYNAAYNAYMADTRYTMAEKEYKDTEGNEYFYPNSFIYYIARTNKTAGV